MASNFPVNPGYHYGFAPSGLPQSPAALTFLTHAPGDFSNAGHNLAIQAWAGFNLLNSQHARLAPTFVPLNSETAISLGGNHLNMF